MESQSNTKRIFLLFLAVLGWIALIGQFYLIIINRETSVAEAVVRYFTFFTILTNLLIAVCTIVLVIKPASYWGKFFSRPSTLTAIAVSITIVGAVYNIILRSLWKPQGFQRLVDELLHLVIPVLFIIFWVVFVPKGLLKWRNILLWMVYPLVYLLIVIVRGMFSGYYPYPFLDINTFGYPG
ncbi:MAG: Pr6Pr family membrane protein, partial [Mucilaginibacter sp.]